MHEHVYRCFTFKILNRRRHNSDWLPLIFDTILFSLSKEISRDDKKKLKYLFYLKRGDLHCFVDLWELFEVVTRIPMTRKLKLTAPLCI